MITVSSKIQKLPFQLNGRVAFFSQPVPEVRLELTRKLLQRLLRPQRLPISPSGLVCRQGRLLAYTSQTSINKFIDACSRKRGAQDWTRTSTVARYHLKVVRLPISPPGHFLKGCKSRNYREIKKRMFCCMLIRKAS